ncbi:MAG: translation initiation factor IF-6 [Candidatus Helarchaeota archaeon]|nr:translation initiation factor IF-6 [Candidatus Helarchaeota archaeon]
MIIKQNFFGNTNIGVFSFATDDYCVIPEGLTKREIKSIEETLKVPSFTLNIAQAHILHTLSIGNKNGYLVPHTITDKEFSTIQNHLNINIERVTTELTALGNNILCNDKAAIINPDFEKNQLKIIEDALGVEAVKGKILGPEEPGIVGSQALCTNKGVLVHVDAADEILEWVGDVLGVEVDIGTINAGYPYIASGVVANSHGAVVGDDTTGPEIVRLGQVFDVV